MIVDSTEAKKHITDNDPWATEWLSKNPAGWGAFQLDKQEHNEIRLIPNTSYWAGKPAIDEIVQFGVGDRETGLRALEQGDANCLLHLYPEEFQRFAGNDNFTTGLVRSNHAKLEFDYTSEPFDDKYVTYVWFDALLNYISAIGWNKDHEQFNSLWPADYHLMAKDILTTHCVYWPSMLLACEIELPKTIFAHGWWLIDDKKMSKSIGNIRLVHDLKNQYSGEVLRLTLLSAHYRQPLNWTKEIIDQNSKMLDRLYRSLKDLQDIELTTENLSDDIMESLLDDLNTPKLLAHLNTLANKLSTANKDEKNNIKNNLIAAGKILGILREDPDVWLGYNQSSNPEKEEIERLINQRNEARRDKDFKLADEIRDKLKIKGIEIEDTNNGTIWRKDS